MTGIIMSLQNFFKSRRRTSSSPGCCPRRPPEKHLSECFTTGEQPVLFPSRGSHAQVLQNTHFPILLFLPSLLHLLIKSLPASHIISIIISHQYRCPSSCNFSVWLGRRNHPVLVLPPTPHLSHHPPSLHLIQPHPPVPQ